VALIVILVFQASAIYFLSEVSSEFTVCGCVRTHVCMHVCVCTCL